MARGVKVQGWCAHYDKWVLHRLIEMEMETSENSLVGRIIREWVDRKAEEHAALGLTRQTFLEERQRTGGKLFSFPKSEGLKEPMDRSENAEKPKALHDKPAPRAPERLGIRSMRAR